MNHVTLCGRLTRDPEVRDGQAGKSARYSLAVDRDVRREDGTRAADFINCVCFGKTADFAEHYLTKGMKILVEGRINTGSYTNREGQKVYTFDVIVSRHEFVESRRDAEGAAPAEAPREPVYQQTTMNDFVQAQGTPFDDDLSDEGLPWN